ncbi:MAG: PilZ domain-containing protein [Pseudomonadota bacterium]
MVSPMRHYIRHPSEIPIQYRIREQGQGDERLSNISRGGLSFYSKVPIEVGVDISLSFPLINGGVETHGRVVWCRSIERRYLVGVEFFDPSEAYNTRMVEQICYIEHYRQEVLASEGRNLSAEEAAKEWIEKYAEKFPDFNQS